MQNTENSAAAQEQAPKSRRAQLMSLSAQLRPLVEQGKFNSLNEALLHTYQNEQDEPVLFKSIPEWNKEGCSVKPGSKGFAIWGKPRPDTKDESKTYYPMAYVFASNQVTERQPSNR